MKHLKQAPQNKRDRALIKEQSVQATAVSPMRKRSFEELLVTTTHDWDVVMLRQARESVRASLIYVRQVSEELKKQSRLIETCRREGTHDSVQFDKERGNALAIEDRLDTAFAQLDNAQRTMQLARARCARYEPEPFAI